jgi:ABC-type polysaccharide/polyol phosphate transport system ATPase subunit
MTKIRSAMATDVLISVEGVSKKFCTDLRRSLRYAVSDIFRDLLGRQATGSRLRDGEFWALRNVSFEVRPGESLGVMGVNGAGKSTLLKLVLGSLRLTEGRTVTRGRLAALSEYGLGFDPVLTGRENAYMSAAVLHISRRVVKAAMDEIVAFAELEAFIDAPLRSYSDGMRARLGFAVAMFLAPDVLLVDEVLTVGDLGFQRRGIEHAKRYLEKGGALVLVSHNPHLVQSLCQRCLVLDHGRVVFDGDVVGGVARYFDAVRAAPDDVLARDPVLVGHDAERGGVVPLSVPSRSRALEPGASPEANGIVIEDFGIQPLGTGTLRTGSPARIFVRIHATTARQVRWGFCLLTADLATTIACDGRLTGFPVAAGRVELSGTVPRLPLARGRYALRVTIMDPATELPFALGGFGDAPSYFAVEMPTSLRNNYRMFTHDLVVLEDLTWAESSGPSAEPAGESALFRGASVAGRSGS